MRSNLIQTAIGLPRFSKQILVLVLDASLCALAVWLAFYLRLGEWVPLLRPGFWQLWLAVALSVLIAVPVFVVHGFYLAIYRYAGWAALIAIAKAMLVYGMLYMTAITVMGFEGIPRTLGIIQPVLLFIFVAVSRVLARYWLGGAYQRQLSKVSMPKMLIYGAGDAGRQIAVAMSNSHEMQVVGFLDDDDRLHGHILNGQPIYAPADLPHLVNTLGVAHVLLALPSITRQQRIHIVDQLAPFKVQVRTLPSLNDLAQGRVSVSDIRELEIDDLLGRDAVAPDQTLLTKNVSGKVVLVTGAGGSIGSELCRQILTLGPSKLLLIEQSEFALYQIHQELEDKLIGSETLLVPLLASVQERNRMREIIASWLPHTIYHAAAYKHVPLVEHNVAAGVKNNVLGTLYTAQAALESNVSDFVLISTDKAVRPTNVMGGSKRLAEMALQALAACSYGTRFSMVRFGNVLGSSGSVVPKFRRQIRDGGPITITHAEVTRYFMTIPEAAQLVIQAGAMASGGDVFVLDMGQPIKIMDLARRMIELSGYTVKDEEHAEGDIEIAVTGLRPGEKLYEELLIGDSPEPTGHPRIMKAKEDFVPWNEFEPQLNALLVALNDNDVRTVRSIMRRLVSGYVSTEEIVDWLYLQRTEVMKI